MFERGTLGVVNESGLHDRIRQAVGVRSYRHVAELTGTNHESVRRYLTGQTPSVEFLTQLSRALGLSTEWLLTGRGPMLLQDVRASHLRESPAPDLLMALASTVETLLVRIDRLERFVQTMELRIRAASVPTGEGKPGDSKPGGGSVAADGRPGTDGKPVAAEGANLASVVVHERVASLTRNLGDVLAQRSPPPAD